MKIFKTVSNTITKLLNLIDRVTSSVDNIACQVEEATRTSLIESRLENTVTLEQLAIANGKTIDELLALSH